MNFVSSTHPTRNFYVVSIGSVPGQANSILANATTQITGGCPANHQRLAIDSNPDAQASISLEPSEKFFLSNQGLAQLISHRDAHPAFWACLPPNPPRELHTWLAGANLTPAANQLRVLGLALLYLNIPSLKARLESDMSTLIARTGQEDCEIHLLATSPGGTGSGGLLPLIALIYSLFPNAKRHLHLFITGRKIPGDAGRAGWNQLALLHELSAAMVGAFLPVNLSQPSSVHRIDLSGALHSCFLTSAETGSGAVEDLPFQQRLVAQRLLLRSVSLAQNYPPELNNAFTFEDKVISGERAKLP